jgi:DNA-binding GntR family transcriptional regulator
MMNRNSGKPENPTKGTLVDAAYRRLKAAILSNELLPGFQATEPEMAALMEMSRTPVREALIRLQGEGLVDLVPRRGVRVLPVRASDMREIYDILTVLESSAAENIARMAPGDAELSPLDEATAEMEAALEVEDLDAWAAADDRFHRALLEINGNTRLIRIVSALMDQAHRARMVTLRMREKPERSTRDHREILMSLRAGDAARAGALFREHRRRAAEELLAILENYRLPVL